MMNETKKTIDYKKMKNTCDTILHFDPSVDILYIIDHHTLFPGIDIVRMYASKNCTLPFTPVIACNNIFTTVNLDASFLLSKWSYDSRSQTLVMKYTSYQIYLDLLVLVRRVMPWNWESRLVIHQGFVPSVDRAPRWNDHGANPW